MSAGSCKAAGARWSRSRRFRAWLARVEQLLEHRDALVSALEMPLTERQLFVLLLAYNRPVSVDDLVSAVLALEPSELFARLQRLRHGTAAYQLLYKLKKRALLRQGERASVAVFGLRRPIRARFTKALDRVFPTLSA